MKLIVAFMKNFKLPKFYKNTIISRTLECMTNSHNAEVQAHICICGIIEVFCPTVLYFI